MTKRNSFIIQQVMSIEDVHLESSLSEREGFFFLIWAFVSLLYFYLNVGNDSAEVLELVP